MTRLFLKLRDWWRGYTAADIASVYYKVNAVTTRGRFTHLTPAERRAWRAMRLPRVVRARG